MVGGRGREGIEGEGGRGEGTATCLSYLARSLNFVDEGRLITTLQPLTSHSIAAIDVSSAFLKLSIPLFDLISSSPSLTLLDKLRLNHPEL